MYWLDLVVSGQGLSDLTKYVFGHNPRIWMQFDDISHKGHLHGDIIKFCKTTVLFIIQRHNWGTEGEIVTMF